MVRTCETQLLSPSVRLLRPVARKRGAPYVAAAPDFDFFTVDDFRAANGGLEPEQARSRAHTCPQHAHRAPF